MRYPQIKSNCLRAIVSGSVIEYGSGMYGTSDGSQFLGKPSTAALIEATRLLSNPKLPKTLKVTLSRFAIYTGLYESLKKAFEGGAK